jgi:hypothetical protein
VITLRQIRGLLSPIDLTIGLPCALDPILFEKTQKERVKWPPTFPSEDSKYFVWSDMTQDEFSFDMQIFQAEVTRQRSTDQAIIRDAEKCSIDGVMEWLSVAESRTRIDQ